MNGLSFVLFLAVSNHGASVFDQFLLVVGLVPGWGEVWRYTNDGDGNARICLLHVRLAIQAIGSIVVCPPFNFDFPPCVVH